MWLDTDLGIVFPALCLCLIVVTTYLNTYLLCSGASQCARHQSDKVEFGVWGHSQQLLICLLPMCEGVGVMEEESCVFIIRCGRLLREKKTLDYNGVRFYVQLSHFEWYA